MKQGHHYHVYILERSDKSYSTGVTNNFERRLWEYEAMKVIKKRCFKVVKNFRFKYCPLGILAMIMRFLKQIFISHKRKISF